MKQNKIIKKKKKKRKKKDLITNKEKNIKDLYI